MVLLVQRADDPYKDFWVLPGGFVRPEESLEEAAQREVHEESGLDAPPGHLEQLASYGEPDRDPRLRVVSVAYLGLLPELPTPSAGTDAADAKWWPVAGLEGERCPRARLRPCGASSTMVSNGPEPSSNTRAWLPRSSMSHLRCAIYVWFTRRSGVSNSTPPTSAERSTAPRVWWSPRESPPLPASGDRHSSIDVALAHCCIQPCSAHCDRRRAADLAMVCTPDSDGSFRAD